jgi:hypothetical protein
MALSVPFTKQSNLFAAHDETPTPEVNIPPKSSQPRHELELIRF